MSADNLPHSVELDGLPDLPSRYRRLVREVYKRILAAGEVFNTPIGVYAIDGEEATHLFDTPTEDNAITQAVVGADPTEAIIWMITLNIRVSDRLSDAAVRHVIAHEFGHIRRGHILRPQFNLETRKFEQFNSHPHLSREDREDEADFCTILWGFESELESWRDEATHDLTEGATRRQGQWHRRRNRHRPP